MPFGARITPGFTPGVTRGRVSTPRPPVDLHLPPVHFYAEATVNPGAEAMVRSEAISNRTGKPIDIHEIRLSASTTAFTDAAANTLGNFGVTRVRLVGNGKVITNGFVPIWNLGRTENRYSQTYPYVGPGAHCYFVWRLSRPWHLPPDYPVECQFFSPGMINIPVVARISLAGRYVSGRKTTTSLPFAASYVSKLFDYSTVDSDESSEKDLANYTGKTIHIDRFIARVGTIKSTAGANSSQISDVDDQANSENLTFRMVLSDNHPIVPEFVGFRQVFHVYPSAVDVAHDLENNQFYRVSLRKTAGLALQTAYTTYRAHASVSIVGWREEGV